MRNSVIRETFCVHSINIHAITGPLQVLLMICFSCESFEKVVHIPFMLYSSTIKNNWVFFSLNI